MGKKVREYKSGDFIFAKVKGYPAWPARVQKPNGKKYLVYFYGTGEIANLPPNMIFDYSENKDKFLTKTVKRRDFNEGVKQIEYDFANNVPLEEVIGVPIEVRDANNTANDSAIDTTLDDTTADTTANDTAADDTNVTQADAAVEDSDETGALVIDEGKTPSKGRKPKEAKSKETPKAVKTPRGKKREEPGREEEKTDEELVSRSGRKIRPKRYMDEQTEDNATLPSPAPKRRRAASPEKPKESEKEKEKEKDNKTEKSFTQYNVVKQSELEGMKKPFEPSEEDKDKENILLAYLGNGQYAGIRVFDSRPAQFKDDAASLAWHKRAARNALHTKMQLERQHIPASSVSAQLVMELNLTDEEKAALDKERETEEKKSRVNFLKTEMKLIELDAKIKTCLCLEKADTELCLKLLDELLGLEVKPLMLLKHPTCLETVKRLRAYVGNTPSWDLSEQDAFTFSKRAHAIRRQADNLYNSMKEHFQPPEGLSFWEYFSSRVLGFKKATASLNAGELLELVHEPKELSEPQAHTMRAAIDEANSVVPPLPDTPELEDDQHKSGKKTPVKAKKPASSPAKARRGRNKKEEAQEEENKPQEKEHQKEAEADGEKKPAEDPSEPSKEPENTAAEQTEDVEMAEPEQTENANTNEQTNDKDAIPAEDDKQKPEKSAKESEKNAKDTEKSTKDNEKSPKDSEKTDKKKKSNDDIEPEKKDDKKDKKNSKTDRNGKESEKSEKESEKSGKESDKSVKENDKSAKESDKSGKESDKSGKEREERVGEKSDDKEEKEKMEEPRAKRSRESKKTDPPPRSPAKRKSKV